MLNFSKVIRLFQLGGIVLCLAGCLSIKTDAVPSSVSKKLFISQSISDDGHNVVKIKSPLRRSGKGDVLDAVLIDVAMLVAAEHTLKEGHTFLTFVEIERDFLKNFRNNGGVTELLTWQNLNLEYYFGEPKAGVDGEQKKMNASNTIIELRKSLSEMEAYVR